MSKLIKPQINFTTIPNHIINDKRLSFKAKGLFLYLISKPDGWSFSSDRIVNDCNDGLKSVKSGLIELENLGLLTRQKIRIGGVFKGFDYILSFDFSPSTQNGTTVSPSTPFASTEKPLADNGSSNKDSLSKKDKVIEREKIIPPISDFEIDTFVNSEPELTFITPLAYELSVMPTSFLSEIHAEGKHFSYCDEFLLHVSKMARSPISYRSKIRASLYNHDDKNHSRTIFAYFDFLETRPDLKQNGVLPVGVNIFDLIGRD